MTQIDKVLTAGECEELRIEGIDAYYAGQSFDANPHRAEAALAWDAGWRQAEQAQHEQAQP